MFRDWVIKSEGLRDMNRPKYRYRNCYLELLMVRNLFSTVLRVLLLYIRWVSFGKLRGMKGRFCQIWPPQEHSQGSMELSSYSRREMAFVRTLPRSWNGYGLDMGLTMSFSTINGIIV